MSYQYSIVIPTLNSVGMVSSCIEAIKETCKTLDYEIIVGCDDCKPETEAYFKSVGVKYIPLKGNQGFSKVCNAAAKEAKGKFLVFLNDDTLPAKKWLLKLQLAYNTFQEDSKLDGKVGAVGPLSNYVAGLQQLKSDKQLTAENRHQVVDKLKRKIGFSHFLSGMCVFISKDVFFEVGCFDERFFNGCFPAGIQVRTAAGSKDIQDVQVGEQVITHDGSLRTVEEVFERKYEDDLIAITITKRLPIYATPEHPFQVFNTEKETLEWKAAEDLRVGDLVATVFPAGCRDSYQGKQLSPSLARLIGLYLAEGGLYDTGSGLRLYFSYGSTEGHLIDFTRKAMKQWFNAETSVYFKRDSEAAQVYCNNKEAIRWFESIPGKRTSNREVPYELLELQPNLLAQLVIGWLEGDGHASKEKSGGRLVGTSANLNIVYSMVDAIASIGGVAKVFKKPKMSHPLGWEIKDGYHVQMDGSSIPESLAQHFNLRIKRKDNRGHYPTWKRYKNCVLLPVREIEREPFSGNVYNFETTVNHSYIVNGCVVHNCEDNALSVKLLRKGYHLVVAGDSYVFHHGSKTLRKPEYQYLQGGVKNVPDFMRWYADREGEKQLGVIYRVKIRTEYHREIFLKSLERSAACADKIFVLDDGSSIKWFESDEISEQTREKIIYKRYEREFEERRDRNELINMARDAGCDWIISLDSDEILENKVTREYMQRLMRPPSPYTLGYSFAEYTFWNGETHWRSDGVWGKMRGARMWRVQPNRSIRGGADSTLHCEHLPIVPPMCIADSSIRIKHYGYVHAKERETKYEWYEKHDTDKRVELIGGTDYFHLIDESDLHLRPWIEDSTVTIATICKNEMQNVIEWVSSYWAFADQLLVCDTGSSDGTDELLKQCGVQVVYQPWNDDYSAPRNAVLDAVGDSTTWVFQIDMDERLQAIGPIRRALDFPAATGYMFYIKNLLKDGRITLSETIRLFKTANKWRYAGRIHETVDKTAKLGGIAKVFRSPVDILHSGYLIEDAVLKVKMKRYVALSERSMEDDPKDPKPYYSLALHYMEEPSLEDLAMSYLKRAMELDTNFYQPKKELGMLLIRQACRIFNELKKTLPQQHVDIAVCETLSKVLKPYAETNLLVPLHIKEYFASRRNGPRELPKLEVKKDVTKPVVPKFRLVGESVK